MKKISIFGVPTVDTAAPFPVRTIDAFRTEDFSAVEASLQQSRTLSREIVVTMLSTAAGADNGSLSAQIEWLLTSRQMPEIVSKALFLDYFLHERADHWDAEFYAQFVFRSIEAVIDSSTETREKGFRQLLSFSRQFLSFLKEDQQQLVLSAIMTWKKPTKISYYDQTRISLQAVLLFADELRAADRAYRKAFTALDSRRPSKEPEKFSLTSRLPTWIARSYSLNLLPYVPKLCAAFSGQLHASARAILSRPPLDLLAESFFPDDFLIDEAKRLLSELETASAAEVRQHTQAFQRFFQRCFMTFSSQSIEFHLQQQAASFLQYLCEEAPMSCRQLFLSEKRFERLFKQLDHDEDNRDRRLAKMTQSQFASEACQYLVLLQHGVILEDPHEAPAVYLQQQHHEIDEESVLRRLQTIDLLRRLSVPKSDWIEYLPNALALAKADLALPFQSTEDLQRLRELTDVPSKRPVL